VKKSATLFLLCLGEVMGLIKKCRDKMLERYSRVYLVIKIDEKKGRAEQITGKIKSVEGKLGKRLKS